jgi:hypothetical protein
MVRNRADGKGALLGLPLGYSLAGAGVAWALGAWLGDEEIPWLEALIGLGIGVVAYGTSALMDAAI